ALLGMQAQYVHSPPTRSDSMIAQVRPARLTPAATFSPTAPAPITITSKPLLGRLVSIRHHVPPPGTLPISRAGHACSWFGWDSVGNQIAAEHDDLKEGPHVRGRKLSRGGRPSGRHPAATGASQADRLGAPR